MLTVRKAQLADLPTIMQIFTEAKNYLMEQHIPQWQDGTPDQDVFTADIQAGDLYVLTDETNLLGMAALKLGPDQFYQTITNGSWHSDQPYYAIHRFALGNLARGKHLSAKFFQALFSIIRATKITDVRIDTHPQNSGMLHAIAKAGFQYCGIVEVNQEQSDPTRKAFDLNLE